MKRIIPIVIILLAIFSLQAQAVDDLIVPGQRIGWFTLGVSFPAMKKVIGEPDEINGKGDWTLFVYDRKYKVGIVADHDIVVAIVTYHSRYYTSEGIKFGSSASDAISAYGSDYIMKESKNGGKIYDYRKKKIVFFTEYDVVMLIGVYQSMLDSPTL